MCLKHEISLVARTVAGLKPIARPKCKVCGMPRSEIIKPKSVQEIYKNSKNLMQFELDWQFESDYPQGFNADGKWGQVRSA